MSAEQEEPQGVDLAGEGVGEDSIREGEPVLGHAHGASIVLVRAGDEVFALDATCTHYGGPLAEGIFDGQCLRCPWHHAAFDVRTGSPARPPALQAVETYEVIRREGRVFVGEKAAPAAPIRRLATAPDSVVIVGGGAAGDMAAATLRDEGYSGNLTLVSRDGAEPYDRPNVSKDYLAGTAPEDWLPLRSSEFYEERDIHVLLERTVTAIDGASHEVVLDDGQRIGAAAILLATGAEPVRLDIPGVAQPHVYYLRTVTDSRSIIDAAGRARNAVVVGASFIGLEVAASLRTRGLAVHVVAPEAVPMEPLLGREMGSFVRQLHEEHGVQFHLQQTLSEIRPDSVVLQNGAQLQSELVVMGVGVRPRVELAEGAGIAVDRGVLVNEFLETSVPGIWAAGDIARWPDARSGERIRVEHWVVAQRQGQTAARNILGMQEPFDAVPFFWSQHYDVPINYVGHVEGWDTMHVSGSIADRDCIVAYRKNGKTLAVASIYRDSDSLLAELAMEREDEAELARLVPADRP